MRLRPPPLLLGAVFAGATVATACSTPTPLLVKTTDATAGTGEPADTSTDGTEPSACQQEQCKPCFDGLRCAEEGAPLLPGTCCTPGDPLTRVGTGYGAEVVDLELSDDGRVALLCGGFGAGVNDVSNPLAAVRIGNAGDRCQRAAFGDTLDDGRVVFYLTHHGDSWVPFPSLKTYHLDEDAEEPADVVVEVASETDPGILYSGLAYTPGWLYALAHQDGLRVYSTDADGLPTLVATLDGFANATKLAVDPARGLAVVADGQGGVKLVDITDPAAPAHRGEFDTPGVARDVALDGTRAYVALGGSGMTVLDIADPDAPTELRHLDPPGSVQAVDIDGELLALASWSHVGLYDLETLTPLAHEKTRDSPDFEQDLGIAVRDGLVYAGEWEGLHVLRHHPGRVAPGLWIDDEMIGFAAAEADDRVLLLHNRGDLDLRVSNIASTNPEFTVDAPLEEGLTIPPGGVEAIEVAYTPPSELQIGELLLETNDPDPGQALYRLPLMAWTNNTQLDIGDTLTDDFGFLDPNGANQVTGLEGHVVVLAYFALF